MLSENAQRFKTELGSLWRILKTQNTYWHATTIERFKKISSEGIRPSDGQIESDYPNSLGSFFRSVCLFDFFSPSEKNALETEDCWGCFLTGGDPLKIFIEIDITKLGSDCLINQTHSKYISLQNSSDEAKYKNHIVFVECWFTKKIAPSAFKNILLVKRRGRPFEYKLLPLNMNTLSEIDRTNEEWRHLEQQQDTEDRANGIISPEVILLGQTRR